MEKRNTLSFFGTDNQKIVANYSMFFILLNVHVFYFTAEVIMPSGKRDVPTVEDNHDGTVSLKYGPKEEGLHELFVKYNGENVQGKYNFEFGFNCASNALPTCIVECLKNVY